MVLKELKDNQQFREFIQPSKGSPTTKFVHFCAPWAAACAQLDELLVELLKEYGNNFEAAKVDAEGQPELSLEHKVNAVPTVVVFQNGKQSAKVEGFHPAELKDLIVKASFDDISQQQNIPSATAAEETKTEDFNDRLKRLINTARMTLFMKGSPDAPRCGFSRQIVDLLRQNKVDFWTFDILNDEKVRQGLKEYSDWPTYPQLYLDGELLGGLDVIREELNDPTFVDKLPKCP